MERNEYEERLNRYEEEIEEFKKCIKELKDEEIEEDVAWKPTFSEKYWIIDTHGKVCNDFWGGYSSEINSLNIGNIFKTKEDAEFQTERLRVLAQLKQFSKKFEYGKQNYYMYYNHKFKNIITSFDTYKQRNEIYFESYEKVDKAIEFVGEDKVLKYYLGVKE